MARVPLLNTASLIFSSPGLILASHAFGQESGGGDKDLSRFLVIDGLPRDPSLLFPPVHLFSKTAIKSQAVESDTRIAEGKGGGFLMEPFFKDFNA